jgi:hypothetical protein
MNAIAHHPSLQRLSLFADQSIGLDGIKRIGQEIPHLRYLQELDLDNLCKRWPCHRLGGNETKSRSMSHKTKSKLIAYEAAGRALLEGVEQNHQLKRLEFRELGMFWMTPIRFFLDLNQTCRPLVNGNENVVSAIWPLALAKLLGQHKTSQVFFSLREQPWLVPSSSCFGNNSNGRENG